jgi:hypothetical protein
MASTNKAAKKVLMVSIAVYLLLILLIITLAPIKVQAPYSQFFNVFYLILLLFIILIVFLIPFATEVYVYNKKQKLKILFALLFGFFSAIAILIVNISVILFLSRDLKGIDTTGSGFMILYSYLFAFISIFLPLSYLSLKFFRELKIVQHGSK